VYGVPSPPSGTIDLGIGRDPVNRKKMSIRARHKRSAVTYYAVRQDFGFAALLDIRIDTGRTHQIRVHLSAKGHPIIGDPLYGGKSVKNLPDAVATVAGALHRPFLHAYRIEFHHPRSGARLSFFAPLPAELENFLAAVSR
jgi:23S rRNA pseudouridine1911/1915/1917 synthase